jgi:hypothetical protein
MHNYLGIKMIKLIKKWVKIKEETQVEFPEGKNHEVETNFVPMYETGLLSIRANVVPIIRWM